MDDDYGVRDTLTGADDWKEALCRCGHVRGVHGGHDGLARCALRSCYCGAFCRVKSRAEVVRMSDHDERPR